MSNAEKFQKFILSNILILAIIVSVLTSYATLYRSVTIKSSGSIKTILPLHTEGRFLKDSLNNTVVLKGLWKGQFLDTSTGWFGLNAYYWNEMALNYTLNKMRYEWGVNCINIFTWGDWWLENKAKTAGGGSTDIGCRDAIVRLVQVAQSHGIYVQIRLYSPSEAEGRREGFPFQPTYSWTVDDFVNFWANVSATLKDYPNVILTLFDEPSAPSGHTIDEYFNASEQAIRAIRNQGFDGLIVIHWGWCGELDWVERWVQQNRTLYNIVFSAHIYRYHGTFDGNPNSPVNIEYIRNYIQTKWSGGYPPGGLGYKYILDTYNVPIWVSAIGAYNGATDDEEYVYIWNTLQVLNELGLGYVVFNAQRTSTAWTVLKDPVNEVFSEPNRIGQALINAIAGVPPPPTYQLTINSNIAGLQFELDGIQRLAPYNTTLFAGNHTIVMPPSVTVYTHHPIFGNTEYDATGKGFKNELYTAGPYTINSTINISSIYIYTENAGKVKLAIYNSTNYVRPPYPDNWPHPGYLIVQSEEYSCQAKSWNAVPIQNTTLEPGTYFIAIKIDTNGMLAERPRQWFGQYLLSSYSDPFPNPFGTISGGTGYEFAVYIPAAPLEISEYRFFSWEDDPAASNQRVIELTSNTTFTVIYGPFS